MDELTPNLNHGWNFIAIPKAGDRQTYLSWTQKPSFLDLNLYPSIASFKQDGLSMAMRKQVES